MDTYAIRGEVDYTSQQKKIGGEYEHVGEVLREVAVSNPYDAGATRIELYPLYTQNASCMIVLDNGVGMDPTPCDKDDLRSCNGHAMSSLASYFHIGHSTKPRGKEIGQFCMGSNLALVQADALFALVTRTRDTPVGMYWVVVREKMHTAFSDRSKQIEASLMAATDAQQTVLDMLQEQSECYITAWKVWVDHAFAHLGENQGTMQLFVSKDTDLHRKRLLDVEQRAWPEPARNKKRKAAAAPAVCATPLYTYLRMQTRHGSVLHFPKQRCEMRQREKAFREVYEKDMRQANLTIFCDACVEGETVPYGFPYIQYGKDTPDMPVDDIPAGAAIRSKTGYWARLGPREFTRSSACGKTPVAVFVIMDSYTVKMEEYEGLDRNGCTSRSGIPMHRTNGVELTAHGVHIVTLRGDTFDRLISSLPTVDKDPADLGSTMTRGTLEALLAWNEKHKLQNLTIVIDHVFDMKTDRNNITPAEMQRLLQDRCFLTGLANALQSLRDGRDAHSRNFDAMLTFMLATKKREDESRVEENALQRAQDSLDCGSLRVAPRGDLDPELAAALDVVRETYALPGRGHENSLVHLFGLYGAAARALARIVRRRPELCPDDCRFHDVVHHWVRYGLLFSGPGVDAQIFDWNVCSDAAYFGEQVATARRHMRQCEFKILLEDKFNHPFPSCDLIVVGGVSEHRIVTDSLDNTAQVIEPPPGDPLHGIGCYLEDIRNGPRILKSRINLSENLRVPVIHFPRLIRATFETFASVSITPPFKNDYGTRQRRTKRART